MLLDALKHVSPYQDKEKGLVNVFIETPKGSRETISKGSGNPITKRLIERLRVMALQGKPKLISC